MTEKEKRLWKKKKKITEPSDKGKVNRVTDMVGETYICHII